MNTIKQAIVVVGMVLVIFGGCSAPNPHPMAMDAAVQNAKTGADHIALAEHYEQTAQEFLAKVAEHRKLLKEYQNRSYLYGKQGMGFQAHCETLIGLYQKAADTNMEMAKIHRQIAAEKQ